MEPLDIRVAALNRGRQLRCDGKPRPKLGRADKGSNVTVRQAEWIGYGLEMAAEYFARRRALELLGLDEENHPIVW